MERYGKLISPQAPKPQITSVLESYWELNAKVDELVNSRRAAHMPFISARIDTGALHGYLLRRGYPILFPIVTTVCDHAVDVLMAHDPKAIAKLFSGESKQGPVEVDVVASGKLEIKSGLF